MERWLDELGRTRSGDSIRAEIRSWNLPLRSDKTIEDLSRMFQSEDSGLATVLRAVLSLGTVSVHAATGPLAGHWAYRKYKKLRGIEPSSFKAPPAAKGGDRKNPRVMVGSDVDKPSVAGPIVNAVRIGARDIGIGEILAIDDLRGLGFSPAASSILVVPNEFFLLGIYRDHRSASCQRPAHLRVNI